MLDTDVDFAMAIWATLECYADSCEIAAQTARLESLHWRFEGRSGNHLRGVDCARRAADTENTPAS